jgi:hypothetical protein
MMIKMCQKNLCKKECILTQEQKANQLEYSTCWYCYQENKTVKFEAIKLLESAQLNLNKTLNDLEQIEQLGLDNEADTFATYIKGELETINRKINQSIQEAKEFW